MRAMILGCCALLGACGSNEQQSTTIQGTTYSQDRDGTATIENEKGRLTAADGAAAAATSFPDFAPQYPGSTITTSLTSERQGIKRTSVVMETDKPVREVADFYKSRFEAAGLTPKSSMVMDDAALLSSEAAGKKASATIGKNEAKTTIALSFSGG